jgi:Uma2 family endonuclease
MIQKATKLLTFEEFLKWKPESGRYELHEGAIIEMQPTGKHEEITGFLSTELTLEFRRLRLPYFILKQALLKAPNRETGYSPDVLIVNRTSLATQPLWEKFSTITQGAAVPLVVEVVSTNWQDDYLTQVRDYEEIGIPEYWIVDYLGLEGKRYIGSPKQPTISIYYLVEGEYQVSQFRGANCIESPTLPELKLTAEQVFAAGNQA